MKSRTAPQGAARGALAGAYPTPAIGLPLSVGLAFFDDFAWAGDTESGGGGGGGTGDFVGPASSTDLSIMQFDGTTGKLGKVAPVKITGAGAMVPDADGTQQLGNKDFGWTEVWTRQVTNKVQASAQTPSGGWNTSTAAFWTKTGGAPQHTHDGTDRQLALAGANSDITSLSGLTTALSVAQGGTNATTAAGARSSLGAAASGANSDITSLSALSTPLSVAQGGTNATTAAGARSSLGAAAAGANSDITSLSGLTTALSVAQGGIGAVLAAFSSLPGIEHDIMLTVLELGSIEPVGTATTFTNNRRYVGASAIGTAQTLTGATMASLRPHAQWRGTVTTGAAVGLTLSGAVAGETFPTDRLDDYYVEGGFAISNVAQIRAGFGWMGTAATLYAAFTATALSARIVVDGSKFYGVVGDGAANNNVMFTTTPVADTFYRFGVSMVSGTTTFTLRDKNGVILETRTVAATPLGAGSYVSLGHQGIALSAGTYYKYPGRFVVCRAV